MTRRSHLGFSLLIGLLGLAVASSAVSAQTVDEIVARNIEARGGAARIKAIQSIKEVSHLKIRAMSATITLYAKRPSLSRQEVTIAGATEITAFDGTTAWGINPMSGQTTPQVLTGAASEQVRTQADFDPPLLDYKSRGTTIAYLGTAPDNLGHPLIHLRLMDRRGQVLHVYLDSATALETKVVADGPNGPVETALGDYRDVGGLKMPFSIRTTAGGVVTNDMTVDSIQFDLPMPASLFALPGRL